MPFTLAHPTAALPLWYASGRRLRLAALVIGSTTPDFEYFIRLQPTGSFGHSIPGLFVFCLPAGCLALWLFDSFGRRGIEVLLPAGWRLPQSPPRSHTALSVACALLLGAASHVLWDAFTHSTGSAVELLPALSRTISLGTLSVPWYKILQHGSSLLGIAILGTLAVRWVSRQPKVPGPLLAMRVLLLGGVPLAVGALNGLRFLSGGLQPFVVASGVAFTFTVAVVPVLVGAITREKPS